MSVEKHVLGTCAKCNYEFINYLEAAGHFAQHLNEVQTHVLLGELRAEPSPARFTHDDFYNLGRQAGHAEASIEQTKELCRELGLDDQPQSTELVCKCGDVINSKTGATCDNCIAGMPTPQPALSALDPDERATCRICSRQLGHYLEFVLKADAHKTCVIEDQLRRSMARVKELEVQIISLSKGRGE